MMSTDETAGILNERSINSCNHISVPSYLMKHSYVQLQNHQHLHWILIFTGKHLSLKTSAKSMNHQNTTFIHKLVLTKYKIGTMMCLIYITQNRIRVNENIFTYIIVILIQISTANRVND